MLIELNKLTKIFGRANDDLECRAVDEISFQINSGETVAVIGPNGAGKSTTLKMLSGILYPTSGSASVAGLVPWKDRQALAYKIGIVFGQRSQLLYHLTVNDSFDLLSKIYDLDRREYKSRVDFLSQKLAIENLLKRPVKTLSLGERMRCEIAASLLHKPQILFLDEPTIGLDVTAKALLREHLKTLAESESTTIILTSHDTGDIEEICERVLLINNGRLLIDKPLTSLKADFSKFKLITILTAEAEPHLEFENIRIVKSAQHTLQIEIDQTEVAIDQVVASALRSLTVKDLSIDNAPLEEIVRTLFKGS